MRNCNLCCFCNTLNADEYKLGKIYTRQGVTTHYFCLLLSTHTRQEGGDCQGILGFLCRDIKAEVRKRKSVLCTYCKKTGASIYCANSKCRTVFHLPCGLKKLSHHNFFGSYQSFCDRHRPVQKVPKSLMNTNKVDITCGVCLETVTPKPSPHTVWSPCCANWHHKECLQRLALHAGYFFKCPFCNNKENFEETVKSCGIFVPEQDASWELVPNAYEELLQRHSRCDAKICRAKSRDLNLRGKGWELILCKYCGSQGIHRICGNLKRKGETWNCSLCAQVLNKDDEETEDENTTSEETAVSVVPSTDYPRPIVECQNIRESNEESSFESQCFITYQLIKDVEENLSVCLSSGDSDVDLVNYEPGIRSIDNESYKLKTHDNGYLGVTKCNRAMSNNHSAGGDVKVRRTKSVILIDDDGVRVISETESEYD